MMRVPGTTSIAVLALVAALGGLWPAPAEACDGCCCGHGTAPACSPAPVVPADCCAPADDPVDPPVALPAPSQTEVVPATAVAVVALAPIAADAPASRDDRARAAPSSRGLFTLHAAFLI